MLWCELEQRSLTEVAAKVSSIETFEAQSKRSLMSVLKSQNFLQKMGSQGGKGK